MTNIQLTQELVKSLFDYKDGFLYWKSDRNGSVKAGSKAGCLKKSDNKYRVIISNKSYLCSRIIFLWHHGYLPEFVDHENRDTSYNFIDNLRAASRSDNNKNRKSFKNASSKYLGVYFRKDLNKWGAKIQTNKVNRHLGIFENEIDAAIAYNNAALLFHGEFANPNIIRL